MFAAVLRREGGAHCTDTPHSPLLQTLHIPSLSPYRPPALSCAAPRSRRMPYMQLGRSRAVRQVSLWLLPPRISLPGPQKGASCLALSNRCSLNFRAGLSPARPGQKPTGAQKQAVPKGTKTPALGALPSLKRSRAARSKPKS